MENWSSARNAELYCFLDFLSFRFGSLEGAVIRGHTVDYASP